MKKENPTNVEFKPKFAYMEKMFKVVYTTYVLSYKIMPLKYQIIVYISL